MYKGELIDGHGWTESWTNITKGLASSNVMDIKDAIEDAITGFELESNLNKLDILYTPYRIDRETDKYVRLVSFDGMGNPHYIKAYK